MRLAEFALHKLCASEAKNCLFFGLAESPPTRVFVR